MDKAVSTPAGVKRAVIFLGAPGAGKGTQAREAAKELGVPHLSTGDMFRENVAKGTELGRRAEPIMKSGALVPDDITLGMVEERIGRTDCARGFIFDGFPRTLAQAEKLDELLQQRGFGKATVVYITVPDEIVIRRVTGRRTCKQCGAIYNIYDAPPKVAGRCDHDGAELVQRADDSEQTARSRIEAYHRQTLPLVEHYRRAGALVEVDGTVDAASVNRAIMKILRAV